MQQIENWLKKLGMTEYAQRFAENRIDLSVLPDLTDQHLEKLGVALGDRLKILRAIRDLGNVSVATTAPSTHMVTESTQRGDAERRQLTVMFCDLVGSTGLSSKMDPEDLQEVISSYQMACVNVIQTYDGLVAKFMGDGILSYYGYPRAHEDDGERAVRAGLTIVRVVSGLKTRAPEPLQVRIGISTGLVVVGDLIGSGEAQERGVVGETPNLAARLQSVADPNAIVIGPTTRRILGNLFEYQDLGRIGFKGFDAPVQVYQVLRPSSVSIMPVQQLDAALDQLVTAELIFQRGSPPDAEYTFKHALVQDTAYSTLLRGRRQQIHARIALILEDRFPEIVEAQPELLGQHCSEGGFEEKAIGYWTSAGERAAKSAANAEAIRHFRRALQALEKQPQTAEHSRAELRVLAKLGPALATVEGWAAPTVETVYRRAHYLAKELGNPADAVPALVGLWLYHFQRGEQSAAHQATQELFEIGHSLGDHGLLLQAHHSAWPTSAYRGQFTTAIHHVEQGLALYDERTHSHHAIVYLGHDPAVCAHCVGAVVTCILGYPDQAESRAKESIRLARRLGHAPSLAHALWFVAKLQLIQDDPDKVLATTTELLALCREHHLAIPKTAGTIFQGWAKARVGQVEDGLHQLRSGLQAMTRGVYFAHRVSLLAEICALAGNWSEASMVCEEAHDMVRETGDEWFLAKILCLRGELRLNGPRISKNEAEIYLNGALEVARRQQARLYGLRAGCDLARLWRDQGKRQQARDLLAQIYGWFTEGFDIPVLREAKSLADDLA
jgi:class 3 adenylate cyclase/predicted ATPase